MCTIKLKADNGTFVIKEGANPTKLAAAGAEEDNALELQVIMTGGYDTQELLKMKFKAGNDFVALGGTNGDTIVLNTKDQDLNSEFEVFWVGCNKIALKAANGLYVSRFTDSDDILQASRTQIGPWETFTVIEVN